MATPTQAQTSTKTDTKTLWKFDPMHLQVEFTARHLGMMTVRGHFTDITATGNIYPDNPTASSVEVTIETASIHTHDERRDNDLRSSNFLQVDQFPTMSFKSTKIEPTGQNRYNVTGDLTIKGDTRPVTLAFVNLGEFNDPMMGHRIGYSAETKINRKDFGMTFSMMLDGRLIVSEEVGIFIEGEFVEAPVEAPKA